jgi:hypothetical protein
MHSVRWFGPRNHNVFLGLSFWFSFLLVGYYGLFVHELTPISLNGIIFTILYYHMSIYVNTSYILSLSSLKAKEATLLQFIGLFALYLCASCFIVLARFYILKAIGVVYAYIFIYVSFVTALFFFYNLTTTSVKTYIKQVFLSFGTKKLLVFYMRYLKVLKSKTDFVLLFFLTGVSLALNPLRYVALGFLFYSLRFHNGIEVLIAYASVCGLTVYVSLPSVQKHLLEAYGPYSLRLLGWNHGGKGAQIIGTTIVLAVPGAVGAVYAEKSLSICIEERKYDRLNHIHVTKEVPSIRAHNASLQYWEKPMETPQPYTFNHDYSIGVEIKQAILSGVGLAEAVDKIADAKGWEKPS